MARKGTFFALCLPRMTHTFLVSRRADVFLSMGIWPSLEVREGKPNALGRAVSQEAHDPPKANCQSSIVPTFLKIEETELQYTHSGIGR